MPVSKAAATANFISALEQLRENGQRVTEPRKALLTVLTRQHGPFTAEELHGKLAAGVCDLVTVYRCISAMEETGIVRRCDFGDGTYRYEFNTGQDHHHHLVCRSCRKAETIDLCVADSLERMARQKGYANVTHMLEIFGTCPNCQRAAG